MTLMDNIARIQEVARLLDDDDPDKEEMLNVEGDYTNLLEWALRKRNEFTAMADANKELAETYSARKKSFEGRADRMKDIVFSIMNAAGERKFMGAAATVSIRDVPPKPVVQDESLVPVEYFKEVRTLEKALISQAIKDGYTVPGVVMDNGSITITIRSK